MLHIVTIAYRFQNLEQIYNSIFMDQDIRWHIAKSNKREDINFPFLKTDKRIILYNVDCEDSSTTKKRNTILENIKDGYFCFIDDDTIFHENMYLVYKQAESDHFRGMVIGEQLEWDGKKRLDAVKPTFRMIDTGNVLCHHSCLSVVRWPEKHQEGKNHKDFLFWDSVYNYYGKKCALTKTSISYYNKISKDKRDIRKK